MWDVNAEYASTHTHTHNSVLQPKKSLSSLADIADDFSSTTCFSLRISFLARSVCCCYCCFYLFNSRIFTNELCISQIKLKYYENILPTNSSETHTHKKWRIHFRRQNWKKNTRAFWWNVKFIIVKTYGNHFFLLSIYQTTQKLNIALVWDIWDVFRFN